MCFGHVIYASILIYWATCAPWYSRMLIYQASIALLRFCFSPFCMDNIYRGLYCIFPCFTSYSSVGLLQAFISYPLPIQFMGFGHVSWFLCMSCCHILQFLFMIFICQLSSNDLPIKVCCCGEHWNWSNYHHYNLVASTNHLEHPVCHSSYS